MITPLPKKLAAVPLKKPVPLKQTVKRRKRSPVPIKIGTSLSSVGAVWKQPPAVNLPRISSQISPGKVWEWWPTAKMDDIHLPYTPSSKQVFTDTPPYRKAEILNWNSSSSKSTASVDPPAASDRKQGRSEYTQAIARSLSNAIADMADQRLPEGPRFTTEMKRKRQRQCQKEHPDPTPSATTDLKFPLASKKEVKDFKPISNKAIPFRVINHWLLTGDLKIIPYNVFALNARNRDAERKEDVICKDDEDDDDFLLEDDEYAKFILGHNMGLVPYPEKQVVQLENIGDRLDDMDKEGRVTMVVERQKKGRCTYCPMVYLCHRDGFIVSCDISWGETYDLKHRDPEMVEVLGTAPGRAFTRSYMALSSQLSGEGYMTVSLFSNWCNKTAKKFFVHHLVLIAFTSARPDGCVGHHVGGITDNRVESLKWITVSENSMKHNLHRSQRRRLSTLSTLEIVPTKYSSGRYNWWASRRFPYLLVDEHGTHVRDTRREGKYIPIQKKTSLINGEISFRITFVDELSKRHTLNFCRFALEAHTLKKLKSAETCDHADRNRENNSCGNLLPRGASFQANNSKKYYEDRDDETVVGVYRQSKDYSKHSYYVALTQEYTVHGPTNSRTMQTFFSTEAFGEEGAKQMANEYRTHFILRKGMCYDVVIVPPTHPKTLT